MRRQHSSPCICAEALYSPRDGDIGKSASSKGLKFQLKLEFSKPLSCVLPRWLRYSPGTRYLVTRANEPR
jgi:hypothetical protein